LTNLIAVEQNQNDVTF